MNDSCLWIDVYEMTLTSDPGLEVEGGEEGLDPWNNLHTFGFWVSLRPRESVKSAAFSSEPMK